MNSQKLIDALARFGRYLPEVVRGVDVADCRWKPPDGAWSILEIVSHLADEEEFDFRARGRSTLTDPSAAWPEINPEGWARDRGYNDGDLKTAVARFVSLRAESVAWLRSLKSPDWSRTYHHPVHGPFRAGDLLGSWAAHDALHLRQIAKRLYQIAERNAGDFSVRYAGEWKA